jgi:hypothetical protein
MMFWARAAIQANPEMVEHLLPAARERLADAQAAYVGGSPTGTVYLAGFVVEMVLKHATLRTWGLGPQDFLQPALAPARARLNLWLGEVPHESYHSMEFWALSLRETFRHRRGQVPRQVNQAVQRACLLHSAWTVAMRYRASFLQRSDAEEFLSRAGWFKANADAIWR